jgi:hypothetical protein
MRFFAFFSLFLRFCAHFFGLFVNIFVLLTLSSGRRSEEGQAGGRRGGQASGEEERAGGEVAGAGGRRRMQWPKWRGGPWNLEIPYLYFYFPNATKFMSICIRKIWGIQILNYHASYTILCPGQMKTTNQYSYILLFRCPACQRGGRDTKERNATVSFWERVRKKRKVREEWVRVLWMGHDKVESGRVADLVG